MGMCSSKPHDETTCFLTLAPLYICDGTLAITNEKTYYIKDLATFTGILPANTLLYKRQDGQKVTSYVSVAGRLIPINVPGDMDTLLRKHA